MTIRELIQDETVKFYNYEVFEPVGVNAFSFHTDSIRQVPDEAIYLDSEVEHWQIMNEQDYDDTILANSSIRADFQEWYDDKNVVVLCILLKG